MYFRGLPNFKLSILHYTPNRNVGGFFLWHFDQTLRYFIKFRRLGSGWFWVQCKMENSEWKCLPPAHKPVRTLTFLKFFRQLPAFTCSSTQQDQLSLLIHLWGSRSLKQNFSRSPFICYFLCIGKHDNFSSCKVLS